MPRTFSDAIDIVLEWSERHGELSSDENLSLMLELLLLMLELSGTLTKEKISPNLHLCLHICECALDYGPLSSFWCFSFERMNGILGI